MPGRTDKFYGDGAYDKWKVYVDLENRQTQAIIPPQRNAKIKQHGNAKGRPLSRDVAIREIRRRLVPRASRQWDRLGATGLPVFFGRMLAAENRQKAA